MSKHLSSKVISTIRELRTRGFSLNEIKRRVPAGYGTVYRYIQGVEVKSKYRAGWLGKRGGSKKRQRLAQIKASLKARKLIKTPLSQREKAIFLAALYWAEGSKKDFNLSNTDPEMIRVFVQGLEEIFAVPRDQIRVSIRTYEDLDKEKCLDFWSKIVGIPKDRFINVNILKGKKQGKLRYGMCRIRITKGANMLKYMTAIRKRIGKLFFESS